MLPPIESLTALSPEEVTELFLAEPEGQWFERKSARIAARDLAETLVAMANAEGGMIAIGLSNGLCEGVDANPEAHNAWWQAGIDFTTPPVRFIAELLPGINHLGDPDRLFVINVPPGRQVHSTTRDVAYLRVGDENRRLTFEQRIELYYDRSESSYEATLARNTAELDPDAVVEYAALLEHPAPQRLLQARELLDADGKALIAAQLLFGAHPQHANPQAYIRVLRYAGTERQYGTEQNLVSDTRCEGTLPQQIEAARNELRSVLPRRKALGPDGKFAWFDLAPEAAWLEALVNAVLHRSYSKHGDHTRITVFDDRVEVSSPGSFPGLVAPTQDLTNVPRQARNPRIARVMSDLGYGQELGEGLRRMVTVMESGGRPPPVIRQSGGTTLVTLRG